MKLPSNAFDVYAAMGESRSYQAVADHFGVTKRTVTTRAREEDWQARLAEVERRVRERSDERLVETLDDMNRRHLKTMQAIQRRGLEALKNFPLTSAMEAVRALDMAVKHERLIRGEPTERTATSIEETIRRQHARWIELVESDEAEDDNGTSTTGETSHGE